MSKRRTVRRRSCKPSCCRRRKTKNCNCTCHKGPRGCKLGNCPCCRKKTKRKTRKR